MGGLNTGVAQDEYEATRMALVMHRPVHAALCAALAQRQRSHLLLDGMPGAGKSVALAAAAHWARASGWLVRAPCLDWQRACHTPPDRQRRRAGAAAAAGWPVHWRTWEASMSYPTLPDPTRPAMHFTKYVRGMLGAEFRDFLLIGFILGFRKVGYRPIPQVDATPAQRLWEDQSESLRVYRVGGDAVSISPHLRRCCTWRTRAC